MKHVNSGTQVLPVTSTCKIFAVNFYARNWRLLVPRRPHLVRVTFYGMAGISSPPPPPEQKQRYLPRKSFWPHFDTSHNFTKTSPDNLSVVLTFKYALIPPSWKNSRKFSNGFVALNKTMRRILTSLLCYSLYFSEGFEWVNSSLQHSIRIWDLWWGKAELGGLKL